MSVATPVLEVRGVGKRFGAMWAARDVTLTVAPGSIVGLLGPNGAGKTTVIRLCAGLVRPDTGSVHVAGEAHEPGNVRVRALLGVVSADVPPMGELRVAEVLRLHGTLYGLHGAALATACADVVETYGLNEFLTRRVRVLSTGMRQRVAVACAMLHAPRVLLLDEPTAGLDPDVRAHLWACLRGLAQRGVALLLTTHYLEEVARLCDIAHLMVGGTVVMSITPAALDGSVARLERAYLQAVQQEPTG